MDGVPHTEESRPNLKGVVIISLPHPDDPSKGKTITAFTLSDDDHHRHDEPLSSPVPSAPHRSLSLSFSPKNAILTVCGAALLVVSLWACLFSEAPYQLLRGEPEEGRRRDAKSFIFYLYPKSGNRSLGDSPGVKLGVKMRNGRSKNVAGSRSSRSSAVFPIRGNVFPDGQYYTSMFIGNPPRPYFLDVDTGSDLAWIQCDAPCTSCAKGPHPLYKPTGGKIVPSRDSLCLELQSNQLQKYCDSCQQCDYEIEYADQSSSLGVLTRDEMHLFKANGGPEKFSFVFGCAYDQQGQLLASPAKTDGILGLSSSKVSLSSQLANQGIINNVVGHCIATETDHGGYMFLGDDFIPLWGVTWIPMLSGLLNLYHAEVLRIRYGGQQLSARAKNSNIGRAVFDTGSSYTYFTNEAYSSLLSFLSTNGLARVDSDPTLPVCWKADFALSSVRDVKQFFEPLILHFGMQWWIKPLTFTIPPEGYLIISNKGNVCLGILDGSEIFDGSTIILGDISLRGKMVIYDNVQQKIGWIESECAIPQRTNNFPFFF